ncbi:hypothetical protein Taro_004800 [Colocasia esculenta]|uniref:Pentatricopeptide repeat-containing protein n=1 Tax=Colocasia esculenta TaxID=4460 RepID=A0A843TQK8_COLES|nr:hypothetical protein [Colocasia esculenta]
MNSIKQLHAHSLRNGLDLTYLLLAKLLEVPSLAYARRLLDACPATPPTFLCNKLLQAYSLHGPHLQCLSIYSAMRRRGCPASLHSFTFLFAACASVPSPSNGRAAHAHLLKFGLQMDAYVATSLLDMYAKSGLMGMARQLFDEMPQRDVPSWNSIIGGYAKCGKLEEARVLFESMPRRNVISWTSMVSGYAQNCKYEEAVATFMRMWDEEGVRPNEVTVTSVLPACANLGALELGKRIDAYAKENGFMSNLFVSNALLEMYAKCGSIDQAKRVFEEMGERKNLCSWNSMIMGLAVHGGWNDGLRMFHEMRARGINPDDITFVGVLSACTHGGLVDQGLLHEAYSLITSMPMKPDSVIWGALLGACSFHRRVDLAEIAAEFLFELEPWNPGNYVILSNIYASLQRWDGVAEVWKRMKGVQHKKAAGYSSIEVNRSIHKFLVEDKSHPMTSEIYALLDIISMNMNLIDYVAFLDSEFEVGN